MKNAIEWDLEVCKTDLLWGHNHNNKSTTKVAYLQAPCFRFILFCFCGLNSHFWPFFSLPSSAVSRYFLNTHLFGLPDFWHVAYIAYSMEIGLKNRARHYPSLNANDSGKWRENQSLSQKQMASSGLCTRRKNSLLDG